MAFLKRLDQALAVGVEAVVAEPDRLPPRQRLERLGQRAFLRHARAVDKHGDDPDLTGQRSRDFDMDVIAGVVDARLAHPRPRAKAIAAQ